MNYRALRTVKTGDGACECANVEEKEEKETGGEKRGQVIYSSLKVREVVV
jgi:hypothetical protein